MLQYSCEQNLEVMWLINGLKPDFRTISDFRKANKEAIRNAFREFNRIYKMMGLIKEEEFAAIDGTKIRANNSRANCFTAENLQKRLDSAEEKMRKYLDAMDENDKLESDDMREMTVEELTAAIGKIGETIAKLNEIQTKMTGSGKEQICLTDPESALMNDHGHYIVAHNVQAAVLSESHMVGDFQVVKQCNDVGTIESTSELLKETLEVEHIETAEDKGYVDRSDILNNILNGDVPHVIPKNGDEIYKMEIEFKEAEITEELINSEKPEDIKTCVSAGVLPKILQNKGIELETQNKVEEIKYERTGKGVKCPHGKLMTQSIDDGSGEKLYFRNCHSCPVCYCNLFYTNWMLKGCVPFKDGESEILLKQSVTPVKVKIKFKPNAEKMSKRKEIVEHVFGTVKRYKDAGWLLLKGIAGATAEFALQFSGYNLTRAVNMLGVPEILRRIEAI
jgi:transposase